jgi:transposase
MKQKSESGKTPAEQVLKDIRRAGSIRRTRGSASCWKDCAARRTSPSFGAEGIAASMYYGCSKEFLEAGKRRLAGDTARAATSGAPRTCCMSLPLNHVARSSAT